MQASLTGRSAASEDDALNGHAFRGLPGSVNDGALAGRGAEARVGVGTGLSCNGSERGLSLGPDPWCPRPQALQPPGNLTILGAPFLVLPGSDLHAGGQRLVEALPVDTAVTGLSHVGEDGVFLDGPDGVGVGLYRGSRGNPKKAIFRVDSPQVS